MQIFHIYCEPRGYICGYETVYCSCRQRQTNSFVQPGALGEIERVKNTKEKNKIITQKEMAVLSATHNRELN